jgi:hypothetical protein
MSSVASQKSGVPASETLLRKGTATIPQNLSTIAVADTRITASSVVVCQAISDNAVSPATQAVSASLRAGVGFSIVSSAVATNPGAGLVVGYAVLQY